MKIYVAARTSQRQEVEKINNTLKKLGHEVFDWTGHKNTRPYEENKKLAKKYSIDDVDFVKNSDVFILLSNRIPGLGSTTEFGMALLSNKLFNKPLIYVVGGEINNMFFYHPAVKIRKLIKNVID